MAEWWSIEVLHGEFSAFQWQASHDSDLIEAALTNGALDGSWHADRWGSRLRCASTPDLIEAERPHRHPPAGEAAEGLLGLSVGARRDR
jgi:hypothetical protein